MPAEQLTTDDYPYGRQPPAILRVRDLEPTRAPLLPRLWPWILRAGAIGIVVFLIVATPIGIVGYRATRQATMIAELEQLGCRVSYSFDRTDGTSLDTLQGLFGHNGFADVSEVSAETISPQDAARVAEICGHFQHLGSFSIVSNSFRFDQIASWKHLHNLHFLEIFSTSITDDDVAKIAGMPNLASLMLSSPHITDAGVHQLASSSSLVSLHLQSVQLTGNVPPNRGGFPNLQHLTIADAPRLSDQAIINLGPMPELRNIVLYGTQVSDTAIAHLAKAGKLQSVLLGQTNVTDAALVHLASCQNLVSLDLAGTQVTDAGIVQLATCALSNLELSGTPVTGKGFGVLSGNNLTLNLNGANVSDGTLPELLRIAGLSVLSLQNTNVTGATFPPEVAGGPPLVDFWTKNSVPVLPLSPDGAGRCTIVDLSGAALTPAGFKALAATDIPDLKLSRTSLTDQQLLLFAGNDQINLLDISQTNVTASGLVAFYEARKQRLAPSARQESLYVTSDFADIAEKYLPAMPGAMPAEEPADPPAEQFADPPSAQPPM